MKPTTAQNVLAATLTTALLALAAGPAADAAVITDPALASGSNAINPNGLSLDAENQPTPASTPAATLEARSDFRVLQDYTGFVKTGGNQNPNIVSFTDPDIPDLRFNYVVKSSNFDGEAHTSDDTSSGTSAMRLQIRGEILIEFGDYDAGSETFTPGRTVDAASFMFNEWRFGGGGTIELDVEYEDTTGVDLHSQNVTLTKSNDGPNRNSFFAYDGNDDIAAVRFTRSGDFKSNIHSFDDFGFTIVPEPASAVAGALGLVMLIGRRHRRA